MTIPLQQGIVYGPVRSRRLGVSLGVNILPSSYKLCSFDCIYCQYGWTKVKSLKAGSHLADLPSPQEVYRALESELLWLWKEGVRIDHITLSGNGEPTLHPELGRIIDLVRELQIRYYPEAKLAILSNSSTVTDSSVRDALNKLDERIMKLDAGREEIIRRINIPCAAFNLSETIGGLKLLNDVVIQSMFFTGALDNTSPEMIADWIKAIGQIKPKRVQVCTVYRPPAHGGLSPIRREKLAAIARSLQDAAGVPAEVYC